jgi:hypothetical protein
MTDAPLNEPVVMPPMNRPSLIAALVPPAMVTRLNETAITVPTSWQSRIPAMKRPLRVDDASLAAGPPEAGTLRMTASRPRNGSAGPRCAHSSP